VRTRNLVQLVYLLQALALLNGLTAVAAVLINLLMSQQVQNRLYQSHVEWQLRTFVLAALGFIISGILCLVVVGFFLMPVVGLWYGYRVAKGWLALIDGKELGQGLF